MGLEICEERPKTRVMLVDDQISVREMVAMVLDRDGSFTVVAEASSGIDGLRTTRRYRPELVISALALPEMNGPELIRALREENPPTRVLVYSESRNRTLSLAGIEAGAHGFVHKTEPMLTLRQAVCAVAGGLTFFGCYATQLLDETRAQQKSQGGLTSKQRVVLQMIAEGMSTKQVAGRLSLSPKTVEHYRTQVMQRLGLHDIASLTRYAVRCGIVAAD